MTKESTHTIYDCLGPAFWTKRKCLACQVFFTPADFKTQNYQLFFKEIGNIHLTDSPNHATLVATIVELQHQNCPLSCGFSYYSEIIQPSKKK